MPVKDGLYDFLQLARQVTETGASHRKGRPGDARPSGDEFLSGFWKGDRLLPVVTVVVYFGAEVWDGPQSLKEMYADCDEEILRHAADYRINLVTPGGLSDAEIDAFRSNMREIMLYIKYSKDKEQLCRVVAEDRRFKDVERGAVEIIKPTGSKTAFFAAVSCQRTKSQCKVCGRKSSLTASLHWDFLRSILWGMLHGSGYSEET